MLPSLNRFLRPLRRVTWVFISRFKVNYVLSLCLGALACLGVMVGQVLGCSWEYVPIVHKDRTTSWVGSGWSGRILVLLSKICSFIVRGLRPLLELVYPCHVGESGGVWFWDGGSSIFLPIVVVSCGGELGFCCIVVVGRVSWSGVLLDSRNYHFM